MIERLEIDRAIALEASRVAALFADIEWYLFGSFLQDGRSSDIDILVVHPDGMDSRPIRAEVADLCAQLPIHLIIMSRSEQLQLDFIAGQRCVRVRTPTC